MSRDRTLPHQIRKLLLAPLVYLIAIFFLCEEWLWLTGTRLLARLQVIPLIARAEARISRFGPYAALAAFALPGLMLLPLKILALLSMAHGHALLGLLVIVIAKIAGTILVARLYVLTRCALLSLHWFARGQTMLLMFKEKMIAQLRATRAWRQVMAAHAGFKAARDRWWERLRPGVLPAGRLRRLIKKWKALRRKPH